jgi:hypothetical protein
MPEDLIHCVGFQAAARAVRRTLRGLHALTLAAVSLAACGESRGTTPNSAMPRDSGGATADLSSTVVSTACDRACLGQLNTRYLESLIAQDPTMLATSPEVRFTENGTTLELGAGLWAVARALREYRQDFAEVSAGQSAGFAALDDDQGPVLLAFRLKVVASKVTEIETLVCRQGQAPFFAPENLTTQDPLYDAEVATSQRSTRDQLIETVDAYFRVIDRGGRSRIRFDADASLNENGTITARGILLSSPPMFADVERVDRRYVLVDEERGDVLSWALFQIPTDRAGRRTLHVAELFKVAGGKIMRIQAIMVNQPLDTPSGWE